MSRIGKRPIQLSPTGVTAIRRGTDTVTAKGPKGELSFVVNDERAGLDENEGEISVDPNDQSKDVPIQMGHVAHHDREHRDRCEGMALSVTA